MKKFLITIISAFLLVSSAYAADKVSADYLLNKKHFAPMNPVAEFAAETAIKKSLKKETGANFKVKFIGYTLSSMKAGVFKYLEISGKDIKIEGIALPYIKLKSVTTYNRVDYTKDPVEMLSDMTFDYELHLSEQSINDALKHEDYKKTIRNVNKRAYPLFMINDVRIKIKDNNVYVVMDYNFPINPVSKNRTFAVKSNFHVVNGIIKANNICIDKIYGSLPSDKVANLINLLDPLSFTLDIMNSNKCNGKIESIKLEDNLFHVNGKIYVKGDNK